MIAKFYHELYFADSLGLSVNNYPFLKQNYSQMIQTRLQDHPSVCGFYIIYAAFHLFKFQQEEITLLMFMMLMYSLLYRRIGILTPCNNVKNWVLLNVKQSGSRSGTYGHEESL